MNKKQFAVKFIASMLSASILAPCATTFGVEGEPLSSETVSVSEKNQVAQSDEYAQEDENEYDGDDEQEDDDAQEDREDHKNVIAQKRPKKCILKNPYVDAIGGGIGLGALIFGGKFLLKHIFSDGNSQGNTNGGAAPDAPHVDPVVPVAPVDPVNPVPRPVTPPAPAPAPDAPQVDPVPRPVTPPAPAPAPVATPEENRSSWNNLHHAAEAENNSQVLFDLTNERKKQYFEERDSLGRTPLYIAFKYNQSIFLDHFSNEYNFRQLYPQSSQEMATLFAFDVLCTAARLDDVQTLSHLGGAIRSTFAYRKASTDPRDYSLLNMALNTGVREANERSLSFGTTAPGYSLLDIALRHNARNAAEYLMNQGVSFDMNNIFGDASLTAEDKLAFLNFLAEHDYDFAGTNGHEPFDVNLILGNDAPFTAEDKLAFLNFLAEHGYNFTNIRRQPPFDARLIFGDNSLTIENKIAFLNSLARLGYSFTHMPRPSQPSFDLQQLIFGNALLTPENKADFLISLARLGYNFAGTDNFKSFINLIFGDQSLTDENRLLILRSLKANGCNFGITSASSAHEKLTETFLDTQHFCPILFKFYIEDCNALSYISDEGRADIQRRFMPRTRIPGYQDLLNYFNQKCEDQPYVPNDQPANPASNEGDDSDSEEDEDDDSDSDDSDSEEGEDDDEGNGHPWGPGNRL